MNRKKLIEKIIRLSYKKKEGHIASSLSVLDILYALYSHKTVDDSIILSKGHASLGLYAVLNHFGIISDEKMDTFCDVDSELGGHPALKDGIIEASTGSLGHGFPIGAGKALAKKIKKQSGVVYVVSGDGEMNEGSMWETLLFANANKLNNLKIIIDYNHSNDRAIPLDSLESKIKSFNWKVDYVINGHSYYELLNAISYNSTVPQCIIANTTKGKGISFMENNPEWHHKIPNEAEVELIIKDLYEKTIH